MTTTSSEETVKQLLLAEDCRVESLHPRKRRSSQISVSGIESEAAMAPGLELRTGIETQPAITKQEGNKAMSKRKISPELFFEQSASTGPAAKRQKKEESKNVLGYFTSGAIGAALGIAIRAFLF